MIYRFVFVSDEVDDFYREIQINSSASFLEFSNAILESVGYSDDQITSFFICEDNWEKHEEITRERMFTSSDVDNWVMADTSLDELIEDEKQRLIYIFDPLTERCFFIELKEIITGKSLTGAVCTASHGNPPKQTVDFDEFAKTTGGIDVDENFYGDEGFDASELDEEGFDVEGGDTAGTVSLDSIDDLY
ncbi:MAG: hypothetical protein IK006_08720 [Bacteroidaceae bacterium]|nr:hypothetical protein [Bacteroidaceae bacterium]